MKPEKPFLQCFLECGEWMASVENEFKGDTSEEAAQHWHNLFMNISSFLKSYAASTESKNIKDWMSSTRQWSADVKKKANKRKKDAASDAAKGSKKQKTPSLPPGVNTGWGKEVHSQMLHNHAKEDLGWKSDATGWMRLENADHCLVLPEKQQAPTLRNG